mmetsp:Transcript_8827/g.28180  ORF Transcript_8827/g.28180 Transcript_8827/m.28180 type:complete len:212 (+) Transcript_8827:2638-3273(+)
MRARLSRSSCDGRIGLARASATAPTNRPTDANMAPSASRKPATTALSPGADCASFTLARYALVSLTAAWSAATMRSRSARSSTDEATFRASVTRPFTPSRTAASSTRSARCADVPRTSSSAASSAEPTLRCSSVRVSRRSRALPPRSARPSDCAVAAVEDDDDGSTLPSGDTASVDELAPGATGFDHCDAPTGAKWTRARSSLPGGASTTT